MQLSTARMPQVLTMTTFTNHTMILSRCRNNEERLFYILYAHKERLNVKELDRSLTNQTFSTLLSDKKNLSKGLLESYPNAPVIFKEEIDEAMKLGANHPMGPLALGDLIGLDVCLAIMEVLYNEFGDSKYRPHPLLRKMVRANLLGRKTGIGFYDYRK